MEGKSTAASACRTRRAALFCIVLVLLLAGLAGAASAMADEAPSGALTVTTLAGSAGSPGVADGSGSAASFVNPLGVACDAAGNIYVGDYGNHTIRKVTPAGVVTTLAGSAGTPGSADGSGPAARFYYPAGVACDAAGTIYVADYFNHTIRRVTPAGVVTTLAGSAGTYGSADGSGPAARFCYPCGVACDAAGNVFVADSGNNTIRKVTPAGAVTTLAGSAGASGYGDGSGPAARFYGPCGVACDAAGNVFVTDSGNNTIRKVTPAGAVTTLAGLALVSGSADGSGAEARFSNPIGIACDAHGNVYVADDLNHTVRKVTPAGVVTTPAGSAGVSGSADGVGSEARFYEPYGVACDTRGNVYVADWNNHTIRKGVVVPALARPVLARLSPSAARRGATVIIIGSGFGARRGSGVVKFGKAACVRYFAWSATRIKVRVPAKAVVGRVKLTVRTAAGVSNARRFTVKR